MSLQNFAIITYALPKRTNVPQIHLFLKWSEKDCVMHVGLCRLMRSCIFIVQD